MGWEIERESVCYHESSLFATKNNPLEIVIILTTLQ